MPNELESGTICLEEVNLYEDLIALLLNFLLKSHLAPDNGTNYGHLAMLSLTGKSHRAMGLFLGLTYYLSYFTTSTVIITALLASKMYNFISKFHTKTMTMVYNFTDL